MSSYQINNKNYPWPDEGESDWGGTVTDFIFALTNAVNDIFAKAVFNNKDQTLTGEKIFSTLPKVVIQADSNIDPTPYNLVYSKRPTNIDIITEDLQNKLNQLRVLIGSSPENTILPDNIADPILSLSQQNIHSIRNYLTGIIELTHQLTPIGSIKAMFQSLETPLIANWITCSQSDTGATFFSQEKVDQFRLNIENQTLINGVNQGFYKLSGGNWAICDGKFILPLSFGNQGFETFGSIDYLIPKLIPNLLDDVFLKGSTNNNTNVTGDNMFTLNSEQLPPHTHNIFHTTQTAESGEHIHEHSRREISVSNYQSAVRNSGNDYFITQLSIATTLQETRKSDEHSHSLTLNFTTQETGENHPIDKTPKHLPVKYYMRVL